MQADAVAIRTEDANITTTVSNDQFVQLPIQWTNGFYGNQAVRNPMSVAQLMPGMGGGTSYFNSQGLTAGGSSINGAPPGTFKAMVDGQDSTSLYAPAFFFYQQPSVEALEEVSVQTGNYSAEFGQAQGGIFNFTAKSGTNQYHGGAFYRLSNEALNAHQPYSGSRAKSRQNNFGFTFGGPVLIPRVYDGQNKTFFFFSFEGFRSTQPDPSSGTFTTVPNANDIQGKFAPDIGGAVMCGSSPCKDALGNTILAGMIYDPLNLAADGLTRIPFSGNAIPQQRWDPVAVKIQGYLPKPMNDLQALNFQLGKTSPRPQNLPSIKVDHNFAQSFKLSAFYSYVGGAGDTSTDGLPANITTSGVNTQKSSTARVNMDHWLRPTLLLNMGVGYVKTLVTKYPYPNVGNFDQASTLGLKGAVAPGFPYISTISNLSAAGAPIGGMARNFGAQYAQAPDTGNFTAKIALSWVKGSHSYKFGGNMHTRMEAFNACQGGWGVYTFNQAQTGQPFGAGGAALAPTSGTSGLGYASFLLGLPNQVTVAPCTSMNWHDRAIAVFAQDNWKVTRKLTLDIGLRYDSQIAPIENRNRVSTFSATTPNPSAGNLLGALLYQGFGPGTVNSKNLLGRYDLAFGPRIGVAYQLTPKTVIRGGWGFFYGAPSTFTASAPQFPSAGTGYDTVTFASARAGASALPNGMQGGLVFDHALFAATLHQPGALPTTNPVTGFSNLNSPTAYDPALGRPPRITQFNFALQRQIISGMTLETAYVANRGAWLQASMFPLNAVTPAMLAARGLSLSNSADQTLLRSQIGSSAVKAAGFSLPFASFPTSATLANALRPFPQYNNALTPASPVGNSWYDSLQMKLNARLRHNITALGTFTWAKSITRIATFNDWTNFSTQKALDANSIPKSLSMNVMYQTPHLTSGFLAGNRIVGAIFSDWQISAVLRYQSGDLITAPTSNNNVSNYLASASTQYMTRVPGQSLYLTDMNGKIDPTQQLMLNPAAWAECGPTATFGCGAPRFTDFRQRRTPQEDIGLGRRVSLSSEKSRYFEIRVEMYNPFNRIVFPSTAVGNPITAPTRNSNGQLTGGFGFMNVNNITAGTARNMLVVARIAF